MATTPPVSDESVKKATGRDWAEWCRLLDREGGTKMTHGEIARLVDEKFYGGGWWSQTVAVGYERLRGLRLKHQKCDGEFEISKSKTIAAPIALVYKAFSAPSMRRKWLADPDVEITTAHDNKSLRFKWVDGQTRVQTFFTGKGEKTAVTVMHLKLNDARAADKMKKYWAAQLESLAEHLTSGRPSTR